MNRSTRCDGCTVLQLHPSGYYAWCKVPESARVIDSAGIIAHCTSNQLLEKIRKHRTNSGGRSLPRACQRFTKHRIQSSLPVKIFDNGLSE
jgi:hypothetical protein